MFSKFIFSVFLVVSASAQAGFGTRGGGDHIKMVIQNAHDGLIQVFTHISSIELKDYQIVNALPGARKRIFEKAEKLFNEKSEQFRNFYLNTEGHIEWDFPTTWNYDNHLSAYTNPQNFRERIHFNLKRLERNLEGFTEKVAMQLFIHETGHKMGFSSTDQFEGEKIEDVLDALGTLVLASFKAKQDDSRLKRHPIKTISVGEIWALASFSKSSSPNKRCISNGIERPIVKAGWHLVYNMRGRLIDKFICDGRVYYGVALFIGNDLYLPEGSNFSSYIIVPKNRVY